MAGDTIFALASARGKAGVAVVRLSGPEAHAAAAVLAGSLPEPRRTALRKLRWQGDLLDEALVVTFAHGASFTGEAACELHLHGGAATVTAVLKALSAQPGLRLAEPGEFTRRALINGQLDLTQVEGLADVIDAETDAQRRQALRVLSGAVAAKVEAWRRNLVRAAALIEATIDFVDEDVPVDVAPEVDGLLSDLLQQMRREQDGAQVAERIRDGFEVAILGAPNSGKSTLLNRLAGREAAIVSEYAGTTRDVIEVRMDLQGLPVTLLDTAGLRETADPVEGMGIHRGLRRAREADLRIFLLDGDGGPPFLTPGVDDICLRGKADLPGSPVAGVSGLTGQGIDELVAEVSHRLSVQAASASILTRERHRVAVVRAIGALESALVELRKGSARIEIAAAEIRAAIGALESLVGRVDVETLLDEIFSSFCIGK
jgi:tRNA modification GTPase